MHVILSSVVLGCGLAGPPTDAFARIRVVVFITVLVVAVGLLLSAAAAVAAVPAAVSSDPPTVYFIGDSVTAGFGYCGTEGGSNSEHITCAPNEPFRDAWYFGDNSLSDCNPPNPVNDRCSNNNDKGAPWNAGPWKPGPSAPTVAYPYVIARDQSRADAAPIEDWAMTGSTPADWDPSGGRFGGQLTKIKNSFVVMTSGANPLLSDYLEVELAGYPATVGVCADSTVFYSFPRYYAADPSGFPHSLLSCFDQQWAEDHQDKHLLAVYKTLLQNRNKVLVLGYPKGCPWSFGNFQPEGNIVDGPSQGHSCKDESYPNYNHPNEQVTQWQQAIVLGATLNDRVQQDVRTASIDGARLPGKISFVLPTDAWVNHQAWTGKDSWFFKNDTWIHPNVEGHAELAATVTGAMCRDYKHWCGDPPKW